MSKKFMDSTIKGVIATSLFVVTMGLFTSYINTTQQVIVTDKRVTLTEEGLKEQIKRIDLNAESLVLLRIQMAEASSSFLSISKSLESLDTTMEAMKKDNKEFQRDVIRLKANEDKNALHK